MIYNEVQRQFALPYLSADMIERYLLYTYPYGIFARIEDIRQEIDRRGIRGVIHYVQAFCYRVIEDIILKETLGVPVITIEGNLPKPLDTRTKLRLEAFVEMLEGQRADGDGEKVYDEQRRYWLFQGDTRILRGCGTADGASTEGRAR